MTAIRRPSRAWATALLVVAFGIAGATARPAGADSVGGPTGPELACLNQLPGVDHVMRCTVERFEPGVPVVVTIADHKGVAARAVPDADGRASLRIRWPFDRSGYHLITAVQRAPEGELRSSTSESISFDDRVPALKRRARQRAAAASASGDGASTPAIEVPASPESQVPLRVTTAIGLGAVGCGVLFAHGRGRRRRYGH